MIRSNEELEKIYGSLEACFTIEIVAVDKNIENATTVFEFPESNGYCLKIPIGYRRELFFDEKGVPTVLANRLSAKLLCEALLGSVHLAHQTGTIDSAKNFREIISYMEHLFVSQTRVGIVQPKK
jgi:hypothetical protein